MMAEPSPEPSQLTVLYDGACPLCRREIGIYRGLVFSKAGMSLERPEIGDAKRVDLL